MAVGIYLIRNMVTGKFYIGSTSNLQRRKADHWNMLRKNIHKNAHLQSSWNIHGEAAFTFDILYECEVDRLSSIEQYLLSVYSGVSACYNMAKYVDCPTRGRSLSASHRRNLTGKRGKFLSMRIAKQGNTNATRKLTSEIVESIRKEYVPYKVSTYALANKYGVSHTMVWNIVTGKNWTCV